MTRRILLTHRVVARVDVKPPTILVPGRPLQVPRIGTPPGLSTPKRLKLYGMFGYTFNQANPNDYDSILSWSPVTKGLNWAQWESALTARIQARGGVVGDEIVHQGGDVLLKKKVVLDAASMCHVAVCGHSWPKEHIAYVNSVSRVGTRCMTGLHNLDSINSGVEWNPVLEPERAALKEYALEPAPTSGCASDGKNAYGCTVIDKYEERNSCNYAPPNDADATDLCSANACGTGKPVAYVPNYVACPHTPAHAGLPANAIAGTKHTMDVDLSIGEAQQELLNAIFSKLAAHYTVGGACVVKGHVFDNHATNPYKGASSLQYAAGWTSAVYRQGWKDFDAYVLATIAATPSIQEPDFFYWANVTDKTDVYAATDVKNRFAEFFFVKDSAARPWAGAGGVEEALARAKTEGLRVVMGHTGTLFNQQYWATTTGGISPFYGTWAGIVDKVAQLDAWDNVYAQVLRQTAGGYVYWQQGFTELA